MKGRVPELAGVCSVWDGWARPAARMAVGVCDIGRIIVPLHFADVPDIKQGVCVGNISAAGGVIGVSEDHQLCGAVEIAKLFSGVRDACVVANGRIAVVLSRVGAGCSGVGWAVIELKFRLPRVENGLPELVGAAPGVAVRQGVGRMQNVQGQYYAVVVVCIHQPAQAHLF